jgi:hypothetical protein
MTTKIYSMTRFVQKRLHALTTMKIWLVYNLVVVWISLFILNRVSWYRVLCEDE